MYALGEVPFDGFGKEIATRASRSSSFELSAFLFFYLSVTMKDWKVDRGGTVENIWNEKADEKMV